MPWALWLLVDLLLFWQAFLGPNNYTPEAALGPETSVGARRFFGLAAGADASAVADAPCDCSGAAVGLASPDKGCTRVGAIRLAFLATTAGHREDTETRHISQ